MPFDDQDPMSGVDQYGGLRVTSGNYSMPMVQAQRFLQMAEVQRRAQAENRSAAVRYQGQMEFQQALASGMPADEAMRRSGPKMFYGHPSGLTAAISHMQPSLETEPKETTFEDGRKALVWKNHRGENQVRVLTAPTAKAPPKSDEDKYEDWYARQQVQHALGEVSAARKNPDPEVLAKAESNLAAAQSEARKRFQPNAIDPEDVEAMNLTGMGMNMGFAGMGGAPQTLTQGGPPGPPMPPPAPQAGPPSAPVAPPAPPMAPPAAQMAAPAPAPVAPAAPSPNQRVRVRSKNGKVGTIPAAQLPMALQEGYTVIK